MSSIEQTTTPAASAAPAVLPPVVVTGNTVKRVADTIKAAKAWENKRTGFSQPADKNQNDDVAVFRTEKGDNREFSVENNKPTSFFQRVGALFRLIIAFITGKFSAFRALSEKSKDEAGLVFKDSMTALVRKFVIALRVLSHDQETFNGQISSHTVRVDDPRFAGIKGLSQLVKGPEFRPIALLEDIKCSIAQLIAQEAGSAESPAAVVKQRLDGLETVLRNEMFLPGGISGRQTPRIFNVLADEFGLQRIRNALNFKNVVAPIADGLMRRFDAMSESSKGKALVFLARELRKLQVMGLPAVCDVIHNKEKKDSRVADAIESAVAQMKTSPEAAQTLALSLTHSYGPSALRVLDEEQVTPLIGRIAGEDEEFRLELLANLSRGLSSRDRIKAAGELAVVATTQAQAPALVAKIVEAGRRTVEDITAEEDLMTLEELQANVRHNEDTLGQLNTIRRLIENKRGLLLSQSELGRIDPRLEKALEELRAINVALNPQDAKNQEKRREILAKIEQLGHDLPQVATALRAFDAADVAAAQDKELAQGAMKEVDAKLEAAWLAFFPGKLDELQKAKIDDLEDGIKKSIAKASHQLDLAKAALTKRERIEAAALEKRERAEVAARAESERAEATARAESERAEYDAVHATWGGFLSHLVRRTPRPA